MSNSLQPHGLQYSRLPCPSLSPRVYKVISIESVIPSMISSSVALFFSCLQYFPALGSSNQVAKALELQLQHQSFQWILNSWFPLRLIGLISLMSKELSRVFSSTTFQKHQFFSAQPSLWSKSHMPTWLLENHSFDYMDLCWQSDVSDFFCCCF